MIPSPRGVVRLIHQSGARIASIRRQPAGDRTVGSAAVEERFPLK